jgi:hypothetical protein
LRQKRDPHILFINENDLISNIIEIERMNCQTISVERLISIQGTYLFTTTQSGPLRGLALWFDVAFDIFSCNNNGSLLMKELSSTQNILINFFDSFMPFYFNSFSLPSSP